MVGNYYNKVMEKLCECGCSKLAPISPVNQKKWGYIKGQPRRFIKGHATKGKKYTGLSLQNIIQGGIKTRFKKGHKAVTDGKNLQGLQAGKTHWNWQGGITKEAIRIRGTATYINWRKTIFKRDDYTCQLCRKRGTYLEADHYPIPFTVLFRTKNWKIMWDISNGRTLCRPCHDKTKQHWRKYYIQPQPPA